MQHLLPNSTLQGGKYRIVKKLGQGGFGITYLAVQTGLERRVVIKEFFMKEFCERNADTHHVTMGTEGNRDTVKRFQDKFLKEARHIAKLNHPHIVRIIDVFDENNTSYYVMEYAPNGSLADKVKAQGALSETVATRYILQVADALDFIHQKNMNHLDVKPGNIVLNEADDTILIDFGLSKQYDTTTGDQTSTTPLGISEGFAPMEQYKKGGVGTFTPETDIYALGATFFFLLTGTPPPSASDVNEDGVPIDKLRAKGVSENAISIIYQSMKGRKKDRMKQVRTFINGLKEEAPDNPQSSKKAGDSTNAKNSSKANDSTNTNGAHTDTSKDSNAFDETIVVNEAKEKEEHKDIQINERQRDKRKISLWKVLVVATLLILIFTLLYAFIFGNNTHNNHTTDYEDPDSVVSDSVVSDEYMGSVSAANEVFKVKDIEFRMIKVEGGTFTMGATSEMENPYDDEKPTHQVTLSSYYIGETEVTQALWKAVMGSNPSYFKGDNLPVEMVSWDDCQTFISKLNALTGKRFRLPTEAEWEFAARGGNQSRHTPFSGSSRIDDVAWYDGNSGDETHPVKTKQPNELGIYDMTGNVFELCQDWYDSYSSYAQTNPTGAGSGSSRVDRGGSWGHSPWVCRSSCRGYRAPDFSNGNLGLRLVLSQ